MRTTQWGPVNGVAGIANSRTLGVDLMGQSPAEMTFLVRAIVDACERRAVPLSLIRIDRDFGAATAKAMGPDPSLYEGVKIELEADLRPRMELYRFPADGG